MKGILVFILVYGLLNSCAHKPDTTAMSERYPSNVGDIEFDPVIDNPNFKPCAKGRIGQYYEYGNGPMFDGGKRSILNLVNSKFVAKRSYDHVSAFVTVRFIVNCRGETGWFRIKQLTTSYEEIEIDTDFIDQLLAVTKSLRGWGVPSDGTTSFDYYQYLTFKIERGQVVDVSP